MGGARLDVGPGRPLRGDRIHRYVNAFCPLCHEEDPLRELSDVPRLSGWLAERDGRIWLERGCPSHGMVRTLYDESPEILAYLEQWTAPTKSHVPDRSGNFLPVPAAYAHGLPAMQTQHTCILLADITEHCNLRCPTCFAESGPGLQGVAPLAEVLANIDSRLQREDHRLDVLMLSGGEPTLHPELEQLVEECVARPIVRILINTNGSSSPAMTASSPCWRGTVTAWRSTCSTTAPQPRRRPITAVPTSGASRTRRSSGSRARGCSRPSP